MFALSAGMSSELRFQCSSVRIVWRCCSASAGTETEQAVLSSVRLLRQVMTNDRQEAWDQRRIQYLELVDISQVVTWAIASVALVVSAATYRLNVRDKRYAWEAQERTQAEEVAGWLVREMCEEHKEVEWKAYVRNSSRSPVYDVLYVVHDIEDLDAAMPEMIPLIPPDTTWDFSPTWFGDQPDANLRVYMTFRDKRGKAWQRDTHGRLTPLERNVDNAPPADPVSGRISYGMIQPATRARLIEVITRRMIKRGKIGADPDNKASS
jgi:hypothetical protein